MISRVLDMILRHLALLALLAAVVVAGGLAIWAVLAWVGLAVSPILPIAALAGALAWSTSREREERLPPPPPAPRRPPSEAEVRALLHLRAEEVITAAELRAALGDLLPPGRTGPTGDPAGKGRR